MKHLLLRADAWQVLQRQTTSLQDSMGITCVRAGKLQLYFFVTKSMGGYDLGNVHVRRIRKEDLGEALQALTAGSPKHASGPPKVFLCGPSSMVDEVSQHLSLLQVDRDDIRFEKWW